MNKISLTILLLVLCTISINAQTFNSDGSSCFEKPTKFYIQKNEIDFVKEQATKSFIGGHFRSFSESTSEVSIEISDCIMLRIQRNEPTKLDLTNLESALNSSSPVIDAVSKEVVEECRRIWLRNIKKYKGELNEAPAPENSLKPEDKKCEEVRLVH